MSAQLPVAEDILYRPTLLRLVGRLLAAMPVAGDGFSRLSFLTHDPSALLAYAEMVGYGALTDGRWEVTAAGARILAAADTYRKAVMDVTERFQPNWINLVSQGRSALARDRSGSSLITCLGETGLLTATDAEAVAFWDRLAALVRSRRDERLHGTGRAGEEATIQLERERTGCEPLWRSLESDALGHDVESVRTACDRRPLFIEVKASRQTWSEATLHLTRNEWRFLHAHPTDAVIDLWSFSQATAWHRRISVPIIAPHIPVDQGAGIWESCQIAYIDLVEVIRP